MFKVSLESYPINIVLPPIFSFELLILKFIGDVWELAYISFDIATVTPLIVKSPFGLGY